MNIFKTFGVTTCLLLLSGLLQADEAFEYSKIEAQMHNRGHHKNCSSHSHSSCHEHKKEHSKPAFLYASTPLDYTGQDVGTGELGDTIQVNFPVSGDSSERLPAIQINPGIFRVLRSGHYLINWEIGVQNFNSVPGVNSLVTVLVKNGIPQPPNVRVTLPALEVPTGLPGSETISGSIVLSLTKGDLIYLNVTGFYGIVGPAAAINSAAINFVRIAP